MDLIQQYRTELQCMLVGRERTLPQLSVPPLDPLQPLPHHAEPENARHHPQAHQQVVPVQDCLAGLLAAALQSGAVDQPEGERGRPVAAEVEQRVE